MKTLVIISIIAIGVIILSWLKNIWGVTKKAITQDGEMSQMQTSINGMNDSLRSLDKTSVDTAVKLGKIESDINTTKSDVKEVKTKLETLTGRDYEIESQAKISITELTAKINYTFLELSMEYERISEKVSALSMENENLLKENSKLRTEIVQLKAKLKERPKGRER